MDTKLQKAKSKRVKTTQRTGRLVKSLLDAEGERLTRRGERLYQTKLKALLEPDFTGMFAAIEPDSGDYFLGKRMMEALDNAEAKHPDKLVYLVRIGSPAAVKIRTPRQL
ncbi:MAG: hypothetical protein ACKV2V_00510 [Blastocatellia bacterium]